MSSNPPPVQPVSPLNWRFPIVNQDGTPSLQFIRLWQSMFGNGDNANAKIVQLEAEVAALEAAALQAGTGITITPDGKLLSNPTIAADIQALLDTISSTQGTILYRGATEWDALAPGTSGYFLETQGAGADPQWAAGGGGGGSLALIASTTLASPAASFDFTSIAATYKDLIVVVNGRSANASTSDAIHLRFNGDSASNYVWEQILFHNTTSSSGSTDPDSKLLVGYTPGSTAPANESGGTDAVIRNYTNTTFYKNATGLGGVKIGAGTANNYALSSWGRWASTAAINRVTVILGSGGNFVTGSVCSLYGRG